MIATLPLDGELVLVCADCGEPSTASVHGTSGWTLRRARGRGRLDDICPLCSPSRHAVRVTTTPTPKATPMNDRPFKPGDTVDVWKSELGMPARWVPGYSFVKYDDENIPGTVLVRCPTALHEVTRWEPANIRHTPRAR